MNIIEKEIIMRVHEHAYEYLQTYELTNYDINYNLTQFIDKLSHIHNNILDLIVINRDNLIHNILWKTLLFNETTL